MRLIQLFWLGMLFILIACFIAGCGSGSGPAFTAPPVQQLINGNGGTVVNGNATLSVPTNAVSGSTLFSIQPTTIYPADTRVVPQSAYIFSSSASSYLASMQISIRYNAALLTSGMVESTLRLYQVSGTTWVQVSGSTVDTGNKVVKGTVSSLGTFAILATSGGGGTVTPPTTLLWLSDTGGLVDIDSKRALLLFVGTLGSNSSVELTTYGSPSTQLGTETIKHAAFSPDGTQVIFDSRSPQGNQLVLSKTDGTGVTIVLTGALLPDSTLSTPRSPSFSLDGTKIVFVYNAGGTDQIYTVKTDGTGLTKLTSLTGTATVDNPAFTKAGNIRFTTTSGSTTTYNLMGADGKNLTTYSTFQPLVAPWYTYSPDGKYITYIAQSSGKYDVLDEFGWLQSHTTHESCRVRYGQIALLCR